MIIPHSDQYCLRMHTSPLPQLLFCSSVRTLQINLGSPDSFICHSPQCVHSGRFLLFLTLTPVLNNQAGGAKDLAQLVEYLPRHAGSLEFQTSHYKIEHSGVLL